MRLLNRISYVSSIALLFIWMGLAYNFSKHLHANDRTSPDSHAINEEGDNQDNRNLILNQDIQEKIKIALKQTNNLLSKLKTEEDALRKRLAKKFDDPDERRKIHSLWLTKRKQIMTIEKRKKDIQSLAKDIAKSLERIRQMENNKN